MKSILTVGLASVFVLAIITLSLACGSAARQTDAGKEASVNLVDLKLDKTSAIKIAEIVLVHVYGKKVLEERPWNVTTLGQKFVIKGSLDIEYAGGVAEIEINRTTAEVTAIDHGK